MGERIGFICGKGHGHTQFAGEIDYGICGSKEVAEITVSVTDREGLYPEYRGLKSSADVAKEIQEIIREWDAWREEKMWEDEG